MAKPTYHVRFKTGHENFPDAERSCKALGIALGIPKLIEVGYYMPQPKYKSWVPNWLIRIITKHQ